MIFTDLFRLRAIVSLSLLLCGCAVSQRHYGVHYFESGQTISSAVSIKVDEMTEKTETGFVRGLLDSDQSALQALFTERLKAQFTEGRLQVLLADLRRQYSFNGQYDRLLLPGLPRGGSLYEGVRAEPFEHYDFVSARFLLKGQADALLEVYSTLVGSDIRVCGFSIMKNHQKNERPSEPVRYLVSETVDRGKMAGRKFVITGQ